MNLVVRVKARFTVTLLMFVLETKIKRFWKKENLCSAVIVSTWYTNYSQSGMKNQLHRDFTVTPRPLRAQEEIQIAGHMYPSGFGSTFLKTFSSVHDVVLIKSIFVQMRVIPTVTGDQNHHRLIEQAPRNLSLCTVCLIRLHN